MQFVKRSFVFAEALIARACLVSMWTFGLFLLVVGALVSPLFGLLVAAAVFWTHRGNSGMSFTHGSARWGQITDLARVGVVFVKDGVNVGRMLGSVPPSIGFVLRALFTFPLKRSEEAMTIASLRTTKPKPTTIRIPDRIPHSAVFGSTGSGKTTCYAMPMLRSCGDSMVCLDSKGELARNTAEFRARTFGHEIAVIDPYGVARGCGFPPGRLNPLGLFRENEDRIVDEARRLASSLVVTTGEERDPFFTKASNTLCTATLAFLMAEAKPEQATLSRMRDILSSPQLMKQMVEHMLQSQACGGLLRRLGGQLGQLQGQTKASVFSVANSHIDFLDSLPLADTVSASSFNPRNLIHGKQTVYICLPVDRVIELAGIQRVLLSTLLNLVFEAGEDRNRRVRFLLDEAATLGSMDSLYNALNFGRSFGHRLMFLFQSTSQVERCFPASQKDDFHAVVASVFCGVNDHRTAKEVSEWIGQTTVTGRSEQTGDNDGSTTGPNLDVMESRSRGSSRSVTYNEVERSLIQPSEVLQLPEKSAIVLLPNVRPILAEKVPYFEKRRTRFLMRAAGAICNLLVTAVCVTVLAGAGYLIATDQAPSILEMRMGLRAFMLQNG